MHSLVPELPSFMIELRSTKFITFEIECPCTNWNVLAFLSHDNAFDQTPRKIVNGELLLVISTVRFILQITGIN